MKKAQVAKLIVEIKGVTISGGGEAWEISTEDKRQKTKVLKVLCAAGLSVGGYGCAHGGWVLRENYVVDTSDFCDKSSPIHY